MGLDVARNIVLVGIMGSGKSALAKAIARKTGCLRIDTDGAIEERRGKSITRIFIDDGEESFREEETILLRELQERSGYVISTGGGMVLREENRPLLRSLGTVVWLTAHEDVIFSRISRNQRRPLLQTENPRATLSALFIHREPIYRAVADVQIDTGLMTRRDILRQVLEAAGWMQPTH